MKKIILICFLFLSILLCNAQQRISFTENKTNKEIIYILPQKVECVDINGHYKRVLLKKVVRDSLFFSDLKIKDKTYSCKYADLKSIQFHKKNEELNQFFAYTFGASAIYFGLASVVSLGAIALKVPQEDGALFYMAIISVPTAIFSGVISHACNLQRSKPFSIYKWKLNSEKTLLLYK